MELGSETEIAEKMVERIPASVRQTPGYKFAVEESKKFHALDRRGREK